jgi:hypothetical protein
MDISKEEALQLCRKWQEEGTMIKAIFETNGSVITVSIAGRIQVDAVTNLVVVSEGVEREALCAINVEKVEKFEYRERREIPTKSLEGWDSQSIEAILAFYGYNSAWQCGFFEAGNL